MLPLIASCIAPRQYIERRNGECDESHAGTKADMSEFPRELLVETTPQPTRYVLAGAYYAVTGPVDDRRHGDAVFHLDEEHLTVFRRQDGAALPGSDAGPVYRVTEQGPLAVPTGKVFVRFAEGQSIEDRRGDIEAAGFRIVDTLSYAPQAGWCEARSGDITDALANLATLKRISDIAAVEPQMLMERRTRS